MCGNRWGVLLIWLAGLMGAAQAWAQPRVWVIETWPPGDEVVLARNQNFYLRLGYETDAPVRIWARPYFQGKPARAGSNPSARHSGSGEALGWFFLRDAGERVDEIRIDAGDGSPDGTAVVATYQVSVVGSGGVSGGAGEPAWVGALRARAKAAQREEYEAQAAASSGIGGAVLAMGFMLVVLALGGFGVVAPVLALRHWRGGWRIAAMVPMALMGFVLLRIVLGVVIDPTSHNLWPFEIAMAGLIGGGVMLALLVARKLRGKGLRD